MEGREKYDSRWPGCSILLGKRINRPLRSRTQRTVEEDRGTVDSGVSCSIFLGLLELHFFE